MIKPGADRVVTAVIGWIVSVLYTAVLYVYYRRAIVRPRAVYAAWATSMGYHFVAVWFLTIATVTSIGNDINYATFGVPYIFYTAASAAYHVLFLQDPKPNGVIVLVNVVMLLSAGAMYWVLTELGVDTRTHMLLRAAALTVLVHTAFFKLFAHEYALTIVPSK